MNEIRFTTLTIVAAVITLIITISLVKTAHSSTQRVALAECNNHIESLSNNHEYYIQHWEFMKCEHFGIIITNIRLCNDVYYGIDGLTSSPDRNGGFHNEPRACEKLTN